MRIVFSARPAYGHVFPLLPLMVAARRAGHDVHVATTGRFLRTLADLGLVTHDVGISIEHGRLALLAELGIGGNTIPKGPDGRPDVQVGGQLFLETLPLRTIAGLRPVLDRLRPDLVVYEQLDVGAAVVAGAVGIPAVLHSVSPRYYGETMRRADADNRIARLWREAGVDEAPFALLTGHAYLDIVPTSLQDPSFRDHPARQLLRPTPWSEPGSLVPFLRPSRPLAYVTLGTIVAVDEVLAPVVHGVATLDVDVLVALGSADGAALGRLPDNVRVEAFVDQPAVLRRASLAVHHGGSGTLLGAAANGVPQVLLPKGADQFFNADLARNAGLADVIEPRDATADEVSRVAKSALTRRRPAIDAVRAEIAAMPSPDDIVSSLAARFG